MAALLVGDQGTLTYTSGNVTVTVDIDKWEFGHQRTVARFRPFGWALPKEIVGGQSGSGSFRVRALNGTTPTLPTAPGTNTAGVLVLGIKGSTQKYSGPAHVFAYDTGAGSTDPNPVFGMYRFVFTADTKSDDTITAA